MQSKLRNTRSVLAKAKNWISLKRSLEPLDKKQEGDVFEELTKCFLLIDPKYRTKLKNVWNVNKQEVPPASTGSLT